MMKASRRKNSPLFLIGFIWALALAPLADACASDILRIPVLNPATLEHWESKSFQDHTRYTTVSMDGRNAIEAHSENAASGLVRKIKVDLSKTPYLHWYWRVDNVLQRVDEKTRGGDDYPARVYVIVSGGWFFWRTRALNYVWSSNQTLDSTWPNAFSHNAVMVAVRSGADQTGQWLHEARNVLEDFPRYMQKSLTHIDAVAIMTDTDNSGQSATAYYGEIYFSDNAFE